MPEFPPIFEESCIQNTGLLLVALAQFAQQALIHESSVIGFLLKKMLGFWLFPEMS